MATAAIATGFASPVYARNFTPDPGDLIVSGSVYEGTANTVTVNQKLPGGGVAVANGLYPEVFQNVNPDSSFGITSPIFLEDINPSAPSGENLVSIYYVNPSLITTSFSSKSELAINLTPDGKGWTFIGYDAPINTLDVSNANTPGIIEPGNPVTTAPTYREVAQINFGAPVDDSGYINHLFNAAQEAFSFGLPINAFGYITPKVTTTNAYPGNNGRAAILDSNGLYFTVGNAGNGNGSAQVTAATGVQIVIPGVDATPATPGTTQVGFFNVTQYGYPADKSAKDNNFRGETIFHNTLYVTKGSISRCSLNPGFSPSFSQL